MSKSSKKKSDPRLVEFSKWISYLKKISKVSECFHHNKAECAGDIKQAHSLQRNGGLSVIEGDVNGNQAIYTFTSFIPGEKRMIQDLKPIGKKEASTFFGFCDYHDTTLFSPVENNRYDDSDKHNFLHSYRSFAHTYHRQKEDMKGDEALGSNESVLNGYRMRSIDAEICKQKLDRIIDSGSYGDLSYLTYIIEDRTHPIACASIITPRFFYNGESFNNHTDTSIPYSYIMLTVLPDSGQTIVILACFSDDLSGMKFLNQLEELPDKKLERAVSSLIISDVRNTFFSPLFWESLGSTGKKQLTGEIESNILERYSPHFSHTKFYHSKINFFDPKYSVEQMSSRKTNP